MLKLTDALSANEYPGRGIIIGRSADNKNAHIAYFIMGRSENSRNRVFEDSSDGIRTSPYDASKMTDPSLIIYHPVRRFNGCTIVTNGDQTDTIRDYMAEGRSFRDALMTRTFEPDAPNFTPRISGIVMPNGNYKLSVIKPADGNTSCCIRSFFEYEHPAPGQAHYVHTYMGNGDPLPPFVGEPETLDIHGGIELFEETIWKSLNEDNKVALYVCRIRLDSGKVTYSDIINKLR